LAQASLNRSRLGPESSHCLPAMAVTSVPQYRSRLVAMRATSAAVVDMSEDDSSRRCQFTKTKLCKFHVLGKCTKGTQCPFAHDGLDLRNLPDLRCTKLCKTLVQTGRCTSRNCLYAHTKDELRSTGAFHKTKLCRFMQTGHCTLGAKCNFAHSSVELREPETIESLQPPPGLGLENMVSELLSDEDDDSDGSTRVPDAGIVELEPAYIRVPGLSQSDACSFGTEKDAGLNSYWEFQNQVMAAGAMDFGCYPPAGGSMAYGGAYGSYGGAYGAVPDPWVSNAMSEHYGSSLFDGGYGGIFG